MHYRVTKETNRRLRRGELFLVDSGAQYQDGTTDVTRTVAIGQPSREMRERFTLRAEGPYRDCAARSSPSGTAGAQIDPFARAPLCGSPASTTTTAPATASAATSPCTKARRDCRKLGTAPLAAGMILSNEPGYYKAGAYGIRIENLVARRPGDRAARAARRSCWGSRR